MDGTSTYIGMIPERKLGVVVMASRGKCQATGVGHRLLLQLAGIMPEEGPHLKAEDMDADHPSDD